MLMFFFLCGANVCKSYFYATNNICRLCWDLREFSDGELCVVCDGKALKSRRENLRKTLSHRTRFQPLAGNPHKKWIWGCFVSETLFKRNGKVLIRKIRVSPTSPGKRRNESINYSENFHKLSILVPFYIALNATKNFHKRDFQSLLKSRDFCLFIPSRSPRLCRRRHPDTPPPTFMFRQSTL